MQSDNFRRRLLISRKRKRFEANRSMKSLIFFILALAAISMTRGNQLDPIRVVRQIQSLMSLSNLGDQEAAILELADLYNYINNANNINNAQYNDCLRALNTVARWIDVTNHSQDIYVRLLHSMKDNLHDDFKDQIDRWHAEFAQGQNIDEPYEKVESFFRRQIELLINEPRKTPAPFMYAIVRGAGLCNIFEFPFSIQPLRDIGYNAKFGKLAYLFHQFQINSLFNSLRDEDSLVLAIQKLGIACKKLREENSLDKERQKAFLSAILDKKFHIPIANLDPYVAGDKHDICKKLKRDGAKNLLSQYLLPVSIRLFVVSCLEDLAERWSRAFNAPGVQMYRASLILRWFYRLEKFFEFTGDESFTNADKYLDKVVKELPSIDAQLAYTEGGGLCRIIDDEEFGSIGSYFESIESFSKEINWSMKNCEINLEDLFKFKHLRTVCLQLRRGRKRDRQQFENQSN